MNHVSLRIRPAAVFLLAVFATLSLFANAQTISDKISTPDQNAIRAIAATLAPVPDRADAVLESVNFSKVARTIPNFHQWPALRKIETAYFSAVSGGGPSEGDKFLLVISKVIAEDHSNAIRSEIALRPYFDNESPINRGGVRFGSIPKERAPSVNANTRAAILAIERYVERVPGGMQSVMARCCNIDPTRAYDILRTSPSRSEALIKAVKFGDLPPELQARLLRLIVTTAETTRAVTYETALAPYLKEIDAKLGEPSGLVEAQTSFAGVTASWTVDDETRVQHSIRDAAKEAGLHRSTVDKLFPLIAASQDNSSPSGGHQGPAPEARAGPPSAPTPPVLGPGGRGSSIAPVTPAGQTLDTDGNNLERYNHVRDSIAETKGEGGVLPFAAMRLSRAGFGGVVFGAPLDVTHIAKAKAVSWVVDIPGISTASGWGHFDIVLSDGKVVMTPRIRCDDAYGAWEILNGRPGVFPALDVARGEGVGLASVSREPYDHDKMVVHPALYGFAIGDAAVLADGVGYKMGVEAFKQRIEQTGASAALVEKAVDWRKADKGYYKIIDAPLKIEAINGLVRVERTEAGGYSEDLRELAFLDFQPIPYGIGPPPPDTFYELLPTLVTAFPEFAELNSFAETFAIVRWGKLSGATIKPPSPPERGAAKLYVFRLPSGELFQSARKLSLHEEAAVYLSDIRHATIAAQSILRAAGASDYAVRRIAALGGKGEQEMNDAVAREELASAPNVDSDAASRVEEALRADPRNINDIRDQFTSMNDAAIALSDPAAAKFLRDQRDQFQTAQSAALQQGEVQDAMTAKQAFDRSVRARMPAWFDASWPTIKNLADAVTPAAVAETLAEATPAAEISAAPAGAPVDVAAIMDNLASQATQKLDWRNSIVDLMKLINLDSSLAARKELAQELNYTGHMNDSASMNIWLHKEVMASGFLRQRAG
jgi:hypothetical protein